MVDNIILFFLNDLTFPAQFPQIPFELSYFWFGEPEEENYMKNCFYLALVFCENYTKGSELFKEFKVVYKHL